MKIKHWLTVNSKGSARLTKNKPPYPLHQQMQKEYPKAMTMALKSWSAHQSRIPLKATKSAMMGARGFR